jgi:hypothetical protein
VVKDTGKTGNPGDIRPLNRPTLVHVRTDESSSPAHIKLRGTWIEVESVNDSWRVYDEWWREQVVDRRYFSIIVDGGISVTVFQDLASKNWFIQRV